MDTNISLVTDEQHCTGKDLCLNSVKEETRDGIGLIQPNISIIQQSPW
jgi:hypothetical protein